MYLDVLAELIKLLGPFLLSMENGRASGGTSNTLVDNTKTWKTDMWKGAYVHIYDGTGKGQIRKIISNTSDTLTVDEDWTEIPDDTSKYRIFISFSEDSVVFQDIKSLIESINNKTVKVDTDNVKLVSEVAYDSDNDLKKIRIDVDNVGLAKEDTLSAIKNALDSVGTDKLLTIPDNPPNLDISLSDLRDALKPTRIAPEQVLSNQSINAGNKAEFTVSNTDGYSAIAVTVKASYDFSATKGIRVRWLYSPDGTNFDSEEDAEDQGNYEDLTFSAGETRQRTVLIPIFQPHVKVQVVNLDSSYPVTVDVWKTLLR